MVPERYLVAAERLGRVVEDSPTQARAQGAGRLTLGHLALHDRVGVLLEHAVVVAVGAQPSLEPLARESRMSLIEIHGEEREAHRRAALQQAQQVKQGVGILAA